ncbi:unnamed protein product [Pieris macdunnoughi]|uniref:Uncharacterized protein n=1 Tax=Pieris macdunnoughi TaxID=345717 RepID=A0A821PCL7_9NEOP|nr:unnamed protein product [Pieris macdunnoughi]
MSLWQYKMEARGPGLRICIDLFLKKDREFGALVAFPALSESRLKYSSSLSMVSTLKAMYSSSDISQSEKHSTSGGTHSHCVLPQRLADKRKGFNKVPLSLKASTHRVPPSPKAGTYRLLPSPEAARHRVPLPSKASTFQGPLISKVGAYTVPLSPKAGT